MGTPTYMPQNEPHIVPIIFSTHMLDFFLKNFSLGGLGGLLSKLEG